MEAISSNIKDPAWWFTVFLVGIIVSVFAGFLKDWISRVITKYSQRFREQRSDKARRREILIEALATNPAFLTLTMVRFMGLSVMSVVLMILYGFVPVMTEIKDILCTIAPHAAGCARTISRAFEKAVIVGVGALTMFISYRASSRSLIVMDGLRRYRKKHDLPPVI